MRRYGRLVPRLIVAIAFLVAGCVSSSPTIVPPTAAPVTPSPAPTPTATLEPSVAPTPQPTVDCATAGSEPGVELEAPLGSETMDLAAGPLESPEPVDAADVPIVSTVVGGLDLAAGLVFGDGLDAAAHIETISADFMPFATAVTLPVAAKVDGSSVTLRLPDKRTDGQLRIAVSWTTECGSGDGVGTIALTVVPSSVTVGCPSTADDLDKALAPLENAKLNVGTVAAPLAVIGWAGRWIQSTGAVDGPQFSGWDPDRTIVAAPAEKIIVRESIADLSMVSLQVAIYRRADVLAYVAGGYTGVVDSLSYTRRTPGPLGRTSIPAPLEPGRYVIDITGSWLTSCLSVDTYSAVSLDVH